MKYSTTKLVIFTTVLLFTVTLTTWSEENMVAIIGGQSVLRSELLKAAELDLERTDLERLRCQAQADQEQADVLQTFLRQIVQERLLELEATRTRTTVEALLASVQQSATPIPETAVVAFYHNNRSRIPYALKDVENQIRTFLQQQEDQRVQAAFFLLLERRFTVDYLLKPFRLDIAADGFPSIGPQDAPVTIVEFSDFECPYCAQIQPTLERAQQEYGKRVRIVYRHYPLVSIHSKAQKAAEASLCANEQTMFWEMHDLMFAEQNSLLISDLKEKAGRLGMEVSAFEKCLTSGRHEETVRNDIRAGAAAGISSTPTLFVNGRPLSGAVSFETLAATINDELDRFENL